MSAKRTDQKVRKKRKVVKLSEQKRLVAEQEVAQRVQDDPDVFKLPESKRTVDNLTDYFVMSGSQYTEHHIHS
jgi:hypothetical protein